MLKKEFSKKMFFLTILRELITSYIRPKPVYLTGEEFLRRFCLHLLPKGFLRIRRFGIYNPTTIRRMGLIFRDDQNLSKTPKTEKVKKETALQCYMRLTGFDPCLCPHCNQRAMKVVAVIPRIRSPAANLAQLLSSRLL